MKDFIKLGLDCVSRSHPDADQYELNFKAAEK